MYYKRKFICVYIYITSGWFLLNRDINKQDIFVYLYYICPYKIRRILFFPYKLRHKSCFNSWKWILTILISTIKKLCGVYWDCQSECNMSSKTPTCIYSLCPSYVRSTTGLERDELRRWSLVKIYMQGLFGKRAKSVHK